MPEEKDRVTIFACGPSHGNCSCKCPDGPCDHKWNGPVKDLHDGDRICGSTVTCSKCGMDAMTHDMWVMP